MKRDWNLMGDIFNALESDRITDLIEGEGVSDEQGDLVLRHLELLIDADYVRGLEIKRSSIGIAGYSMTDPRITLQGYDFADIVKDKKLLNKTLNLIKKAGLMVGFETLKTYAPVALKSLATTALGV